MSWKKWVRGTLFIPLAAGCASGGTGRDSETHFVCSADADCRTKFGDGYGCVERVCEKVAVDDAGPSCVQVSQTECVGASGCRGTRTCLATGLYGSCVCESGSVVPPFDAFTKPPDGSSTEPPDASSLGPLTPRDSGSNVDSGCAVSRFAVELIAENLLVLLDQSTAMANIVTGSNGSWWQGAVDGIEAFATSSMAEGVNMAIQYFPLGASPGSCTAAYDTPDTGFMLLPANAAPIVTSIHAHSPFGFSTLGPALTGGITHMTAMAQGTVGQEFTVVIVTNGPPLLCEPKNIVDVAAIVGTPATARPPITTHVIALDRAATIFEPVAALGGSNQAIAVTGGDVRGAVRDALMSIVARVTCEIELPLLPDGGTIDPAVVDLAFGFLGGGSGLITRVDGASGCATLTRDGWYFDDTRVPARAVLCPDQCAHPRSRRLDVLLGCR